MSKKKQVKRNFKLFCPKISADIEDIVGILLESEITILVNMSEYNFKEDVIKEVIDYVLSHQTANMMIKVRKINPKSFICLSEHPKLYF